jgi:hypothetical protein
LGVVWGVWHTPYFLLPGSAQSNFPYAGYVLLVIAQSVIFGWIHDKSGGSTLMAAIFHAATNAALAYSAVGVGDVYAFWLLTVVTWVAALGLTWQRAAANRPALAQPQNSTSAAS